MTNEIDALLARVDDTALRQDLKTQFDRLRQKRQFGLVFEEHLPERVTLPQHPVRRGTKVVPRDDDDAEPRVVMEVGAKKAALPTEDGRTESVPVDSLVAVAEFGEPIYPGLKRLGSVERGGDKPAHVVIKGENHHALEALRFTHAGKIDCIYIDPPYNTRDKDWKYNNDYVDSDDAYKHSKWLAMIKRRLELAVDLLNPDESVLIVTIDENELHRLGLLLEQVFAGSRVQAISMTINPKGTARSTEFSRVDEFAFTVLIGSQQIPSIRRGNAEPKEVRWRYLRRTEDSSIRGSRPRQFYPIYVDNVTRRVVQIGKPMTDDEELSAVDLVEGATPVFPINESGTEMIWGLTPPSLEKALAGGFVKVTPPQHQYQSFTIAYLTEPNIRKVSLGELEVSGVRDDGSKIVVDPAGKLSRPTTVWREKAHDAGAHGTSLLKALIPGRHFPFPKSLYAVEDIIGLFLTAKPDAVVLDFFVGSGTTAHAVARLNHRDNGRRQAIVVTNNEVSEAEANALGGSGARPGDAEWEALGIFEHITRPRIEAAITGLTPDGDPVKGDYKFTDEFPMSDGFEENVEFFELTYLDAEDIELDMAFAGVAPLLWMRAGSQGPIIEECLDSDGERLPYAIADTYAVLFDPDQWRTFVEELPDEVTTAFVVTDSASIFAGVASELPDGVDVVRLYENYLTTFAINQGGQR